MKKYNESTGCYKIDVFVDGVYLWSTDRFKTCKGAKNNALEHLKLHGKDIKKVTAKFYTI